MEVESSAACEAGSPRSRSWYSLPLRFHVVRVRPDIGDEFRGKTAQVREERGRIGQRRAQAHPGDRVVHELAPAPEQVGDLSAAGA